jgi:phosphoglucosamine mutase
MISASHNPVEYNGIKIFNGDGYKLCDSLEEEIEAIVLDKTVMPPVKEGGDVGRVFRMRKTVNDYIEYLKSTIEGDLSNLKVAVDCANGSASTTAPMLFATLGAECEILSAIPDGININDNCGSTHIERLAEFVRDNDCDVGVAFDGDADRCLAVDENGEVIDGDKLIAIFASALKKKGELKSDTAVVTVLSNFGFFRYAEKNGINVATTKVGDRYVLEKMRDEGYIIGGEQSGHVIFLNHATTGDGQLSAIQLLSILRDSGKKMSELASIMECYPQVMLNVKVGPQAKNSIDYDERVAAAIKKAEIELGDEGRVIVRASGTEPLIRVMVEGKDKISIDRLAKEIAGVIEENLC